MTKTEIKKKKEEFIKLPVEQPRLTEINKPSDFKPPVQNVNETTFGPWKAGKGQDVTKRITNPTTGEVETFNLTYPEHKATLLSNSRSGGQVTPQVEKLKEMERARASGIMPPTDEARTAINQIGLDEEQENRQIIQGEGLVGQAVTGAGAIGGGIVGAKFGAAVGTAIAPGIGTAIGGVAGGVAGAIGGAFTKISYQKKQDVKQAKIVASEAYSNLAWIINQVNNKGMSPSEAVRLWDDNIANLRAAERHLKKETSSDLKRFLSGGSDELAKVQADIQRLGFMRAQLENAILMPDPSKVILNSNDYSQE